MVIKWNDIWKLPRKYPVHSSEGKHKKQYIAEEIAKVAFEEYYKEHDGVNFEDFKHRGGFGWHELVTLLYKRIKVLEEPTPIKSFRSVSSLEKANFEVSERAKKLFSSVYDKAEKERYPV
jgi:hypothetical protein